MPKLLQARPPDSPQEEATIQKLARSRHAPLDIVLRARMIVASWAGQRTATIAQQLDCHPQTVRERLQRFNGEGVDGLQDRPRPGRKRRIGEADRSALIALVGSAPPGCLARDTDGELRAEEAEGSAHWTLNALTDRAQQQGIRIQRSQVRRILLDEGVRWRSARSWMTSTDPEFAKKEPRS